ncbi:VanZ family protein [Terrimicrobium sacchariphilum]|nr:VanZ family protein [Terrimicrobium sacchariphilum]
MKSLPAKSNSLLMTVNSLMAKALKAFSPTVERWWPALLWMVLILIASLDWASGGTTFKIIQPILRWFDPGIPMHQLYEANLIFRKTCHFLQFLILAILIWRTRGSWRFISPKADARFAGFVFLISILFAVGSEYIQSFFRSRTANVTDVFINLSGAVAGILLAVTIEIINSRRQREKSSEKPRILFTANLLLHDKKRRPVVLSQLRKILDETRADALVVAGNIAHPTQCRESLEALKTAVGDIPVAICLGPQDHWLPRELWEQSPSPEAVRLHYWHPALTQTGVHGLDFQSFALGDLEIVGAYGHFDLGFRDETLVIDGAEVSREAYLSGAVGGFEANDFRQIPAAGGTLKEEARRQAEGLGKRLSEVRQNNEIILVTGTIPFEEWLEKPTDNTIEAFFRAFAGNSQMAAAILPHATKIRVAVFGSGKSESHLPEVRGIKGLCLQDANGRAVYSLYDAETGEMVRL